MDIVASEVRSRMMSSIRGSNTSPELAVRRLLHRLGFRFRLHRKSLPGRPDMVLPKHNLAVFVHGCFWHQHSGCRYATMPKSNRVFWQEKLQGNALRDRSSIKKLHKLGWRTLVIWECTLKNSSSAIALANNLERIVASKRKQTNIPRRPTERT